MKYAFGFFVTVIGLLACLSLSQPSRADSSIQIAKKEKVEIFVTSWCPFCQKLEAYLKAKKIRYTRYDIETDSRGRSIHEKLGGGGVPVTRIGDTVVRGFDVNALESALDDSPYSDGVAQPSLL